MQWTYKNVYLWKEWLYKYLNLVVYLLFDLNLSKMSGFLTIKYAHSKIKMQGRVKMCS